jgi:hypothetical protein
VAYIKRLAELCSEMFAPSRFLVLTVTSSSTAQTAKLEIRKFHFEYPPLMVTSIQLLSLFTQTWMAMNVDYD